MSFGASRASAAGSRNSSFPERAAVELGLVEVLGGVDRLKHERKAAQLRVLHNPARRGQIYWDAEDNLVPRPSRVRRQSVYTSRDAKTAAVEPTAGSSGRDANIAPPLSVKAGTVSILLENSGQKIHAIVLFRLNEGVTADEGVAAIASDQLESKGVFVTAVAAAAGASAGVVTKLERGVHLYFDEHPDQMRGTFQVTS